MSPTKALIMEEFIVNVTIMILIRKLRDAMVHEGGKQSSSDIIMHMPTLKRD